MAHGFVVETGSSLREKVRCRQLPKVPSIDPPPELERRGCNNFRSKLRFLDPSRASMIEFRLRSTSPRTSIT